VCYVDRRNRLDEGSKAVFSGVYGFALQQIKLPLQNPELVAEVGASILRQLAGEYPQLAEMITQHAMQPGYDYSEEFEFGLDLILDGLERLRVTKVSSARPRPGR
jgi:hypothetical protein